MPVRRRRSSPRRPPSKSSTLWALPRSWWSSHPLLRLCRRRAHQGPRDCRRHGRRHARRRHRCHVHDHRHCHRCPSLSSYRTPRVPRPRFRSVSPALPLLSSAQSSSSTGGACTPFTLATAQRRPSCSPSPFANPSGAPLCSARVPKETSAPRQRHQPCLRRPSRPCRSPRGCPSQPRMSCRRIQKWTRQSLPSGPSLGRCAPDKRIRLRATCHLSRRPSVRPSARPAWRRERASSRAVVRAMRLPPSRPSPRSRPGRPIPAWAMKEAFMTKLSAVPPPPRASRRDRSNDARGRCLRRQSSRRRAARGV